MIAKIKKGMDMFSSGDCAMTSNSSCASRDGITREARAQMQATRMTEADSECMSSRAAKFRERREVRKVVERAKITSRSTVPLRSALRKTEVANDLCPGTIVREFRQAHWQDHFHEPDGTHPRTITTDGMNRNEERVRRAVGRMCEPLPKQSGSSNRELAMELFFTSDENVGAALLEKHLAALTTRDGQTSCVDDVSGEVLSEEGVRAARKLEMDYFIKMGVYTYVTREEATRSGRGKIIKGRWIDVNKGDSKNPDYRSRNVGK